MNPFVCGSFGSQMEEDIEELLNPCSTHRRTTRKSRDSKNPYANRGLDKFYALLAELEDKKQKIYTQKGSGDISLVRFVYSTSNDWKPVIVKVKDRKKQQKKASGRDDTALVAGPNNSGALDKYPIESTVMSARPGGKEVGGKKGDVTQKIPRNEIRSDTYTWRGILRLNVGDIRCPCVYLPLMIILILLFLAIYGKAFAVVCTSVGWYMVPMITASKDGGAAAASSYPPSKRPKKLINYSNNNNKKKEYARRFSEKSIVRDREGSSSPKSVLVGPADGKSPAKHAHRQSW